MKASVLCTRRWEARPDRSIGYSAKNIAYLSSIGSPNMISEFYLINLTNVQMKELRQLV